MVQFSGLLFLSQVAVAGLQAGVQFSGLAALLRDPEQPSPGAPQPDCGTGIHEGGDERICQHGSVSRSSSPAVNPSVSLSIHQSVQQCISQSSSPSIVS